jgi:hypothetical protein
MPFVLFDYSIIFIRSHLIIRNHGTPYPFQSKRSQPHKLASLITDVLIITVADQVECPIEDIHVPERSWTNIKGSKCIKSPKEFLIYQQFEGVGLGLVTEIVSTYSTWTKFRVIVNKYHSTVETYLLAI